MAEHDRPERADTLKNLSVSRLQRGRYQPRKAIDGAGLARLAQSIQAAGVLQPLFVRKLRGGTFEILAGERRWHAAKMAGLQRVPTIIRNVSDAAALAISLIENLHREDLNPIDQALAIERLVSEFSLTHAEVAEMIGRSRATVTNLLRLLELPAGVRALVADGKLDMGHARALLPLPPEQQSVLAAAAVTHGLSVREVERRVSSCRPAEVAPPAAAPAESVEATEPVPCAGRARAPASQDECNNGRARAAIRGTAAVPGAAASAGFDWLANALRVGLGDGAGVVRRADGRWQLEISFDTCDELAAALEAAAQALARGPQR